MSTSDRGAQPTDAVPPAIARIPTLDAAKWPQYAERLDEPLHIIEIADPDEAPQDRAGH